MINLLALLFLAIGTTEPMEGEYLVFEPIDSMDYVSTPSESTTDQ